MNGDPYAPEDERSVNDYFDKSRITAPTDPSQPFGNAGRNTVRGPWFWQVDLAASKRVPVSEAAELEFRVEVFNLFDRANFRAPNSNVSLSNFGTITQTFDARQVQVGFRLFW